MPFEIKINDKLSLKMPRVEDAQDIYAVVDKDRTHLREWLPWVDGATSYKNTEENIQKRISDFEKGEAASFLIYFENRWIGSVGFITLSAQHKNGEIGYWLSSEFEGRGLMTECVKACIRYGFEELDLHRIVIRCDGENAKSAAIPKKLGFTLEGTLRGDKYRKDRFADTLVFGLLRDEWGISATI